MFLVLPFSVNGQPSALILDPFVSYDCQRTKLEKDSPNIIFYQPTSNPKTFFYGPQIANNKFIFFLLADADNDAYVADRLEMTSYQTQY